ncbi:pilus assembly protein TadG-related protein [Paludisphaera sp.]|uniref:pilus assembly protein TadG-related protein n=1 Tax=Paludisphaera sp. TaxID=2017432 RepID=UPI00301C550F
MRRIRSKSRRGAVAAVAALCLPVLVGMMALTIDGALLRSERQRAQVAADAAAYAALRTYDKVQKEGQAINPPEVPPAVSSAAAAYANVGYPSGSPPQVSISHASPTARYGTADLALRATVTTPAPRLFSGIFGGPPTPVSAEAVAVRVATVGASVIVLNRDAQDSLAVAGSARLVVPGEIRVKSNASRAVNVNNMGRVEARKLKAAGGYLVTSGGSIKDAPSSVQTGADPSAIVDPLESTLAHPSTGGLPIRTSPSGWNATNPFPIQPGLYNSGLILNSGGMKYTMAPGLYYIKSGNFVVSNGVRVTGSGVTIYLYDGNVEIQGGDGTTLTAPTSGDYNGVVLFQRSPKNGSGDYAPHTINIANGTNNKIQGTIYAPGATMALAGGSQTVEGAQLIVNKLNLSNDAKYMPTQQPPTTSSSFHLAR